ncbi:unnamed protein product [Malus baccata var. baccata]
MSNYHRLYYAQSTNGLVCLYLSNNLFRNHTLAYIDPPNFIFNPCTRESIILPHASPAYWTSHVTYHFGFSSLTKEYKVLQVQTFRPHSIPMDMTFMCKIFKLGTSSSWRRLEVDLNDLFSRVPVSSAKCVHQWGHTLDAWERKCCGDYNCFTHRIGYPTGEVMKNGVDRMDGCLALIRDKKLCGLGRLSCFPLVGGRYDALFHCVAITMVSSSSSLQSYVCMSSQTM